MPSMIAHGQTLDFVTRAIRSARELIAAPGQDLPRATVEELASEVVRRLSGHKAIDKHPVPQEEIESLCAALVGADDEGAARFVVDLMRRGTDLDTVYLGHIAGAARHLGRMWEDDLLSFYDVTVATGRIFGLMRVLRFSFPPDEVVDTRMAIFATAPGEDHAIGVTMAADIFRREGWAIELLVGQSHEAIIAAAQASPAAIVAVSAGSQRAILPLARLVVALHLTRPAKFVLVSGHLTVEEPNFIARLGPDAVARDIGEALAEMERLHDMIDWRVPRRR
jgi:methanogenic corrinoid protein MtbC1